MCSAPLTPGPGQGKGRARQWRRDARRERAWAGLLTAPGVFTTVIGGVWVPPSSQGASRVTSSQLTDTSLAPSAPTPKIDDHYPRAESVTGGPRYFFLDWLPTLAVSTTTRRLVATAVTS